MTNEQLDDILERKSIRRICKENVALLAACKATLAAWQQTYNGTQFAAAFVATCEPQLAAAIALAEHGEAAK